MKLLAIIFFAALAGILALLFLFYLAFRAFILWVKFKDWILGAFLLFASFACGAQALPWTDDLLAPDPSVSSVPSVPSSIVPRRPPLPRRLELTWSNAPFSIGAEIAITTNANDQSDPSDASDWCAQTNAVGISSVLFTNLPWGRIYFFDRSIPVTNMPYLVEGPIGYAGSFSGFQNLPALFQGDTLIKWLTNEPDGPSHFYSGPGLTARIIPVPMP